MIGIKEYRNREIINQGDYYKTNYLGDTVIVTYQEICKLPDDRIVKIIYSFSEEEIQQAEQAEDLSHLSWDIDHIKEVRDVEEYVY